MNVNNSKAQDIWSIEFNDVSHVLNRDELQKKIFEIKLEKKGRIFISKDGGLRPIWERFFGLSKRYSVEAISKLDVNIYGIVPYKLT